MSVEALHPWPLNLDEAIRLQENLHQRLVLTWDGREISSLGGVDVCYVDGNVRAAIALFSYPELSPLTTVISQAPLLFPYIPGLLGFRLAPSILAAWEQLPYKPDLLMIHGHGIAHPRRLGLASHIGLWINTPTIGIAKTRLYGYHAEATLEVGEWSALMDENKPNHAIGATLCTRSGSKPIYVSPGHLVDIPVSVKFVLACCRGYRMPEPLRIAHKVATLG